MKRLLIFLALFLYAGCAKIPPEVTAVDGFELDRYLGKWYEIARLNHAFERGLSHVSATYTLRGDGGIDVVNRGWNEKKGRWKEAKGRAYFVGDSNVGRLKVSFFGPFYGGYNVIALDNENYAYALVCGPNRSYLWILAREPQLDELTLNELITLAERLGFATDELVLVEQRNTP